MCFRPAAVSLTTKCPECGAEVDMFATECPECGAAMPEMTGMPGMPGRPKPPGQA